MRGSVISGILCGGFVMKGQHGEWFTVPFHFQKFFSESILFELNNWLLKMKVTFI